MALAEKAVDGPDDEDRAPQIQVQIPPNTDMNPHSDPIVLTIYSGSALMAVFFISCGLYLFCKKSKPETQSNNDNDA